MTENNRWGVPTVEIPRPAMGPFDIEISASGVQDVWNAFVKPVQDAEEPQSVEFRSLVGILRSVFAGLEAKEEGE